MHVEPRCSSSHFLPILPIHDDTGGVFAPTSASEPSPGIDEGGGSDSLLRLPNFASEGGLTSGEDDRTDDPEGSAGEQSGDGEEISRDFFR